MEERAGRLTGKVAIVTGAGSQGRGVGIGKAIAIMFGREGARVGLIDSDAEALADSREAISQFGIDVCAVRADVSSAAACGSAVKEISDRLGRVQILVNNVGVAGPRGTACEVDLAEWNRAWEINVTSVLLMSRCVVPMMEEAQSGAIINIGSVAGLVGGHPALLYPTTKGAVIQMTRAMAFHHGSKGIRVNCVVPGLVYTPRMALRMSQEEREARRLRSLLQTEGTAWDVAGAVLYLASDEARWLTGVILPVDGGLTAAAGLTVPPPEPLAADGN